MRNCYYTMAVTIISYIRSRLRTCTDKGSDSLANNLYTIIMVQFSMGQCGFGQNTAVVMLIKMPSIKPIP